MPHSRRKRDPWSRRDFLKAGACGFCALCLGGLPGEGSAQTSAGSAAASKGFVNPVPSPWFRELSGNGVKCRLCPRECELSPGERAVCRVRENRDGQGYTLAYGNPALVREDPVERLPFFHILPGSRTLSLSTAGCNLSCSFCEVWDMAQVDPEDLYAYDMPPERVVRHARESGLSILSYAFGEPAVFYEYMHEIASRAREEGMANLLHTAAYLRPEPLRNLAPLLNGANVDLKGFDPQFYRDAVGGEMQPVLDALKVLREQGVHLEMTTILIPGLNDGDEHIEAMCDWILRELGPDVPLHFSRFYPLYQLSHLPQTPVSTLDRARDTARRVGLEFVYVARVTGHEGENTFCPGCGEPIIERTGFIIDRVRMEEGKCGRCGTRIPGRWS